MMDSASSGSMQSSSGGGRDNDEYESHGGEPMSSFLKKHDVSSSKSEQQPHPNFFDLSDILDTSFQQNAYLHHYLTSNHLNSGNLSSSSSSLAPFISQSIPVGLQFNSGNNNNTNQASSSKRPDELKNNIGTKKCSKKRSRASRRAPTTVLTTDTTNFRQMVQEFTGIPAPPFIGSRGFDLFSRGHQMSAFLSSNPLRPSSQKGSSSTSPSLLNSILVNNARSDFEVVNTDNGLPPNLKQPTQNQTENVFNNMQNQYTCQPLQQSTISPLFKDRSQGSSSMAAPQADLDELLGMHNHQG